MPNDNIDELLEDLEGTQRKLATILPREIEKAQEEVKQAEARLARLVAMQEQLPEDLPEPKRQAKKPKPTKPKKKAKKAKKAARESKKAEAEETEEEPAGAHLIDDLPGKLKKIIEEKKLSQGGAAELADIPAPTLSKILSGKQKPRAATLEKLVIAFPQLED